MNPGDANVELSCQHKDPQTTSDNGLQQRYDQHHPQERDEAEIESSSPHRSADTSLPHLMNERNTVRTMKRKSSIESNQDASRRFSRLPAGMPVLFYP